MKKIIAVCAFSLTLILTSLNVAAQTQSREEILKEMETKRAELAALEKKFLGPSDADREEFAAFLSQAGTGLIRLLPREIYDGEVYNKTAKKAMTMRGGGAYYSFVRSTHEYGQGSDISFDSGNLSVGFAGADYGMFLNLGDIWLDQVTSEHLAVRALFEYTPPTREPEARKAYRTLWQGMDLSGFIVQSRLAAKVSNTYLVRSISHGRSDIAAALRVVRQDTDGSVILVFKVLKEFPPPKLETTSQLEK